MQGLLQAAAITKHFGATRALAGVDFSARPGEIHALLGENGAGKTTLMNVIAGYLRPDSGIVTLDGAPLRTGSPQAALRAGIASVHQSPMLFEQLSVAENLALGGFAKRGLALADVRRRAVEMAGRLGFRLRLDQGSLRGLSIAERMRLEILRALSFDPRVLILDEPTGLLAPGELDGFLDLLRGLRDRGRSVVLITHKLAEAMAVADRITMLRAGRVVAETSPARTSADELAGLMVGGIPPSPSRGAARDSARVRGFDDGPTWPRRGTKDSPRWDLFAAASRRNFRHRWRGRQWAARIDGDSGRRAPAQPRPDSVARKAR